MQKNWSKLLALTALASAGAVQANPVLPSLHAAAADRGVAVRASVRVALGRGTARQNAQRVSLNIATGPAWRVDSVQPQLQGRVVNADWFRLSMAFDGPRTLSMNGVRLARLNGGLAADENSADNGGGISGLAIVGGLLVVGLGASYLALEDAIDCTENGEYICE